jgi:MerR family transcriptional regulator, mercuric resistance operon regulatory protein
MSVISATPLTIGTLAKRTGCNIETIRYYEKIGVLPKATRRDSGYRAYTDQDVKRLTFIRRARELGFSIEEVKALFRLADEREPSCESARELAVHHLGDVRRKIRDLRSIERVLAETAARCERGEMRGCPLLELLAANPTACG